MRWLFRLKCNYCLISAILWHLIWGVYFLLASVTICIVHITSVLFPFSIALLGGLSGWSPRKLSMYPSKHQYGVTYGLSAEGALYTQGIFHIPEYGWFWFQGWMMIFMLDVLSIGLLVMNDIFKKCQNFFPTATGSFMLPTLNATFHRQLVSHFPWSKVSSTTQFSFHLIGIDDRTLIFLHSILTFTGSLHPRFLLGLK